MAREGLLGRVRWFFVLASAGLTVVFGLTAAAAAGDGARAGLGLVAALALAGLWWDGHRRGRFNLLTDVAVGVGLVALGWASPEPRYLQYALQGAVWVRALNATRRDAAIAVVVYLVGFLVGASLSPGMTDAGVGYLVGRVVVSAIVAAAFVLIAEVLGEYDVSVARERRLRVVGHALAEAEDHAAIVAAALAGANQLIAGYGGHSARLLDDGDGVGRAGDRIVPLAAHGRPYARIAVGGPLSAELEDDLETLGDIAGLALESHALIEARRGGSAAHSDAEPFERARQLAAAATSADLATEVTALWPMPRSRAARIRWLFIAAGLCISVLVALLTIASLGRVGIGVPQVVAVAAPVWLGAWWLYGYRRAGFPIAGDVVVAALLGLVLLSSDRFQTVQPALFASMWVRAAYGSRANVAIAAALHLAALVAGLALTPDRQVSPVDAVGWVVALVVFAVAVHLVAVALDGHARALGRERALRAAGAMLAAVTDGAHVTGAALDGARALLGPYGASVVVASGQGEMAVEAVGGAAAGRGRAIHLDGLPVSLRGALRAGEPLEQRQADAGAWRALDLDGEPGALYVVPLHARGELEGAIVVGSVEPLDAELKDDLATLGALASLAAKDVALRE